MDAEVYLTLDTDWAPEHILEALYSELSSSGAAFTLFCTHESAAIRKFAQLRQCEIALHPNFLVDRSEDAVLSDLAKLFPGTKGIRNHVLYYHSRLAALLHKQGLEFISNHVRFLNSHLEPYYDWTGLVQFPIYWEDDIHCTYFDKRFELNMLKLETPGLKVFNFHPVHWYLNTNDMPMYFNAKVDLKEPAKAAKHQNSGKGIRTLFDGVLKSQPKRTLLEQNQAFRSKNKYEGHYGK